MTSPETFAVSLGACVGVYVAKYCENAGLEARDMSERHPEIKVAFVKG